MKLNPKIFKNLTSEPFEVQDIEGTKVSFYYMNETNYLAQYAGRGKFAIWTSDGSGEYKVIIEKSYYEALKPFYEYDVNKIWIEFLDNAGEVTKKINYRFMIPTLLGYVLIAGLATVFLPELVLQVLLALIVVVILSNTFQTRITSKKVKEANVKAQQDIRDAIGSDVFDELVKAQEVHYQNYFKFEDDDTVQEAEVVEVNEVVEEIKEPELEDRDKEI